MAARKSVDDYFGITPTLDCCCDECQTFRAQISGLQSLAQRCRGVAASYTVLLTAKHLVAEVWASWEGRCAHEFVPKPEAQSKSRSAQEEGSRMPVHQVKPENTSTRQTNTHESKKDAEPSNIKTGSTDLTVKDSLQEKSMTCDHCASHGLSCDGSSVCEQCRFFGQACLYRWCPDGAQSQEECPKQDCSYAHKGSVQQAVEMPRRIVLNGGLPEKKKEPLVPGSVDNLGSNINWPEWDRQLDEKQTLILRLLTIKTEASGIEGHRLECYCAQESTRASPPRLKSRKKVKNRNGRVGCVRCGAKDDYYSVAPCNHRFCYVCAIRHRVLGGDDKCQKCDQPAPFLILTDEVHKPYEEYDLAMDFERKDEEFGLLCETARIHKDALWLLQQRCPESKCNMTLDSVDDLEEHLSSSHAKTWCVSCEENNKLFSHERTTFDDKEYRKHVAQKHGRKHGQKKG